MEKIFFMQQTKKIFKNKFFVSFLSSVFVLAALVVNLHNIAAKYPNLLTVPQEKAILTLIKQGKYRCCLEKPCTYCFYKNKPDEKGRLCDCLDEVVAGEAPCGECLGEILEGEGNHLIKEYFADSIADELGEENKPLIEKIINEKYKE